MPSGCRSSAIVLLLSKQLHILETPAPTQKPVPAVTPWNTGEHVHCKTRCPPRQSTAQVLTGQDLKPQRCRAKHVSCEQPTPSLYCSLALPESCCLAFLPDTFTALLVLGVCNRGASIPSQTAFTLQHKL